jgi:hypothetical protein
MKPDNIELCSAIVVIGSQNTSLDKIRAETFTRLSELGLVEYLGSGWQLTSNGRLLLPSLLIGDSLPDLA